MTARRATVFAIAFASSVGLAGGGCGESRSDFGPGSVRAVVGALESAELEVCAGPTKVGRLANQSVMTHTVFVAEDCHEEIVTLVLDRFTDVKDRDSAARNFEVQLRPRGDGAVWTWRPFTIAAIGSRPDAVMERITDALDELGAR